MCNNEYRVALNFNEKLEGGQVNPQSLKTDYSWTTIPEN